MIEADYKDAALKYFSLLFVIFTISAATHFFFEWYDKDYENIIRASSDAKPRFIVLAYSNKGKITHNILCDEVRDDQEHKQVVCRCADTGELYIFPYPVMVKDVTYTADYINYNKTLR